MKFKKIGLFFLLHLFVLNISSSFATLELVINPVIQARSLWCWAATCEMVFDAYKISQDQYDAAAFALGSSK